MRGQERLAVRPGPKRVAAEGKQQFVATHGDITGARRHRPGGLARTAVEQVRVEPADTVDDLANLIQGQCLRPSDVVKAGLVSRQEDFADAAQVIDVSAGSHLVKVKGGRPAI